LFDLEPIVKAYNREDPTKIIKALLRALFPIKLSFFLLLSLIATQGQDLEEFGLKASDVNSVRNGLLLAEAIEQAFDIKGVTFIYHPLRKCFLLKVLDPSLHAKLVSPSTSSKFSDIDGWPLQHPQGKEPYKRLLYWHSVCAYDYAKRMEWMKTEEVPENILDLSAGALLPSLDLEELLENENAAFPEPEDE
jgi:hypothetical protein